LRALAYAIGAVAVRNAKITRQGTGAVETSGIALVQRLVADESLKVMSSNRTFGSADQRNVPKPLPQHDGRHSKKPVRLLPKTLFNTRVVGYPDRTATASSLSNKRIFWVNSRTPNPPREVNA
jgi:hypothetical protein